MRKEKTLNPHTKGKMKPFVVTVEALCDGFKWPDGKAHKLSEFEIVQNQNTLDYYFYQKQSTNQEEVK